MTRARDLLFRLFEPEGAWICSDISVAPGLVEGQFEGPAVVKFRVSALSSSPTPALRFHRCEVRYSVKDFPGEDRLRDELIRLLARLGEAVDAWFDDPALGTLLSAPASRGVTAPSRLDPTSVLARIAPWLARSEEIPRGWILSDVVEARTFWATRSTDGVVLDFWEPSADLRCLVCVASSDDGELSIWTSGREDIADGTWIAALVRFVFLAEGARVGRGKHAPPRERTRLPVVHDISHAHQAVTTTPRDRDGSAPREVKLILNSPCGQSCSFCSIFQTGDPVSSPQSLDAILGQVESGAREGVDSLRLSGLDPLTHPAVLDIVKRARELGFHRIDVQSPSTRLADDAWLDSLLAAGPSEMHFHIPFFATTPHVHDAVVGRRGAHQLVERAISNLLERRGPSCLTLATVVTRENLHEVVAVILHARSIGAGVVVRLPFPDSESRGDRFFRISMRLTEVAEALVSTALNLGPVDFLRSIEGLPPCVALSVERRTADGEGWKARVEKAQRLPTLAPLGARTPFIPCPRANRCALVRVCGGELLRAYVMLHGDGEFAPV